MIYSKYAFHDLNDIKFEEGEVEDILNGRIPCSEQTVEKIITERLDPEYRFKFISGQAFGYRLVKLQLELECARRNKKKNIWVFNSLGDTIHSFKFELTQPNISFIRAKGLLKTKIEIYIINPNRIKSVRILESKPLTLDQAYALKYYFSKRQNDVRKYNLCNFSDVSYEVSAGQVKEYLEETKNERMRGELLRWLTPATKTEKSE